MARDLVAPNTVNLFDEAIGIISGIVILLYPCDSDLPLASTGVSLAGAYAFSNLIAGKYYVSTSNPPKGYCFSEVWRPYGKSDVVLQNMINEDTLLGTPLDNNDVMFGGTQSGDVMVKAKLRGTGGVVKEGPGCACPAPVPPSAMADRHRASNMNLAHWGALGPGPPNKRTRPVKKSE